MSDKPDNGSQTDHSRRRRLVVTAAIALVVGLYVNPWRSVDAKGYHDAVVLSRVGPQSGIAYAQAIADGAVSRQDLYLLRRAALTDLQNQDEARRTRDYVSPRTDR